MSGLMPPDLTTIASLNKASDHTANSPTKLSSHVEAYAPHNQQHAWEQGCYGGYKLVKSGQPSADAGCVTCTY